MKLQTNMFVNETFVENLKIKIQIIAFYAGIKQWSINKKWVIGTNTPQTFEWSYVLSPKLKNCAILPKLALIRAQIPPMFGIW